VVAEGIEEDEEAFELERLGCTHAQGYLFSRPLSTQMAEELLRANRPLGPKRFEPPSPELRHPESPVDQQAVCS
jgi:predicted signal transduction protein with EAL and GGDEF domain